MSDWIHKFNTVTERNTATYVEPWVSLTKENEQLEYNKINILINGVYDSNTEKFKFEVTPMNNVPLVSIKNITYQYTLIVNSGVIK